MLFVTCLSVTACLGLDTIDKDVYNLSESFLEKTKVR